MPILPASQSNQIPHNKVCLHILMERVAILNVARDMHVRFKSCIERFPQTTITFNSGNSPQSHITISGFHDACICGRSSVVTKQRGNERKSVFGNVTTVLMGKVLSQYNSHFVNIYYPNNSFIFGSLGGEKSKQWEQNSL